MNITAFNKAIVPLVVMGFAYAGTKFGISFGVGEAEALVLLGLITSWLTYLIPNKNKNEVVVPVEVNPLTVTPNDVKIEIQDPTINSPTVVIKPESEATPTLIRRVVQ